MNAARPPFSPVNVCLAGATGWAGSELARSLLLKFAEAAAKVILHRESIDYAHDDKTVAPSGTARELAASSALVGLHRGRTLLSISGTSSRRF